jgi:hypothetical protein
MSAAFALAQNEVIAVLDASARRPGYLLNLPM